MSDTNNMEESVIWTQVRSKAKSVSKNSSGWIDNNVTNSTDNKVELLGDVIKLPFNDFNKVNYKKNINDNRPINNNRSIYKSNSSSSVSSASSASSASSNLKKKDYKDTKEFMIRSLCESQLDTNSMIEKYNSMKNIIEIPQYLEYNITQVIDRLAHNWRFDVIKKLRETNSHYRNKDLYHNKKYSPFHRLAWPSDEFCKRFKLNEPIIDNTLLNRLLDNAYETFKELTIYGFNMFSFNNNVIEDETFLMVINNEIPGQKKVITKELRNLINSILNN